MRFGDLVLRVAFLLATAVAAQEREAWTEPVTGMRFVRVADDLWIGAYEVTQAEWRAIMGTDPSHFKGDRRPVENISWHDAQAFLGELTRRSQGNQFRLPTEEEWQAACRAGASTSEADARTITARDANIATNIEDSIAGRGETKPVGSYPPNAWGLFDMLGNVWEWTGTTADWTRGVDGSTLMVIRGGSWYFDAASASCSVRYTHRPQDVGFSLGFRVVRVPAR